VGAAVDDWIAKYFLGWMRNRDNTEVQIENYNSDDFAFIQINKRQLDLINFIRDRITVNLDENTGLLTTRVNLHDARASAELNGHLIELLKEYVTQYRIEKIQQDLEFIEELHRNARQRFEESQMNLAEFQDRNIALTSARAQTELERLQDEKDLALNLYSSLSQQMEQAKIRLQEETPVFSFLQAVNVPSEKSSPNRRVIVITALFIGIITAFVYVFMYQWVIYLKKSVLKN
jgi:capsule polysaccharide export protein KpsE/RkpR